MFADFDYAQPPLGEIQILRVLESHIKRKKKDQMEKARRFKEELLRKKQEKRAMEQQYDSKTAGRPSDLESSHFAIIH